MGSLVIAVLRTVEKDAESRGWVGKGSDRNHHHREEHGGRIERTSVVIVPVQRSPMSALYVLNSSTILGINSRTRTVKVGEDDEGRVCILDCSFRVRSCLYHL